jgi:ribonuclease VapC
MIALDSSAIIAILFNEPDKKKIESLWANAERSVIGAPSMLECHLVLANDKAKTVALKELVEGMDTEILAFDRPLVAIAVEAHKRFGKGRHKAALNFGDCMSYALAKFNDAPLLCKGDDFKFTDIKLAA